MQTETVEAVRGSANQQKPKMHKRESGDPPNPPYARDTALEGEGGDEKGGCMHETP